MLNCALPRDSEKRGAALIGVGLIIVAVAQWKAGAPVATAIALIAGGVLLTTLARTDGNLLSLLNLGVYGLLVGFTIASQTHAALHGETYRVSLLLLADHVIAIVLLVGLTMRTAYRVLQSSVDSR